MTLSLATDCNPGVTGTGGPGDGVGGTAVGSLGNGDGGLGSGVAPDAGCGCLVSDGARGGGVWALALALVGWALARRRR